MDPKIVYVGSKLSPRVLKEDPSELQEAPERPPEGSKRPPRGQRPPEQVLGPSKWPPEAILEPFWSHLGTILASIFDPPGLHFGTSVVTSFRHVCSLCFSSFYSALRSNQAATKQASQASQASKQAKQAFFCRQPLATKRLASKRWSAVLAEP